MTTTSNISVHTEKCEERFEQRNPIQNLPSAMLQKPKEILNLVLLVSVLLVALMHCVWLGGNVRIQFREKVGVTNRI